MALRTILQRNSRWLRVNSGKSYIIRHKVAIYRPVPANKDRSALRLGNPDIGAIKNPTVLRVLNTLRKRVNQLLDDGIILLMKHRWL